MVHEMVEPVQVFPSLPSGLQRILPHVGIIERLRKTAEEVCHGQLGLPMSVVDSRVDQHDFSTCPKKKIPQPNAPTRIRFARPAETDTAIFY